MVIIEEPASHETAICQWLSSPGTTANQRPNNMTFLPRDHLQSANQRTGNNNQATSLWRIQASIKSLLPCFFHFIIPSSSSVSFQSHKTLSPVPSSLSSATSVDHLQVASLSTKNHLISIQSTNKHRQNGPPRFHLLQDHSGCRLCLCRPGQVLLWQGVCSPLHLQQGFLREPDLRRPLLLP
jgi:hypothetical protein